MLMSEEIEVERAEMLHSSGLPIPEELQRDLDTPVRQHPPPFLARRSRPFYRGGITRKSVPQVASLVSEQESPPQEGDEMTGRESDSHWTDWSSNLDDAEGELRRKVGDAIMLEKFELGPQIPVPEQFHGKVAHPRSVKLAAYTARSSLHEYLPKSPGQHGILYLNRYDFPKHLVYLQPFCPNLE